MKILVVDDEPAVRDSLRTALVLKGYEVALAADGDEALAAIVSAPPDALVLDVLMPRLDGLEVCRRLRQRGDRTPILVLTARTAISDRVAGLDAGADDYLVKPFALDELLARLRALLRRTIGGGADTLAYADLTVDTATRELLSCTRHRRHRRSLSGDACSTARADSRSADGVRRSRVGVLVAPDAPHREAARP